MTAAEAREAARWHREQAAFSTACARLVPDDTLSGNAGEVADHHRRASVALDAYADGIDGGEWTPIGTSFEFRPTSADTNRLHRIRARLLELVPLDGTMSLADDVQRLDRALADAEARGRQSGLFEAWCAVAAERDAEMECYRRSRGQDGGEYWKGVVDTTDEALARVVALAKEATDGR